MIKFIKKYFYKRKIEKKIKYIHEFMCGRISHKTFDPEMDKMKNDIEKYIKEKLIKNKISYEKFSNMMNGLYYYNNINRQLDRLVKDLKSKEPNVEETQNAICEAIERSSEDVR